MIMSLAADKNVVDNERFIQQATAVLAYYAENAELTVEIVDDIKRKGHQRIFEAKLREYTIEQYRSLLLGKDVNYVIV